MNVTPISVHTNRNVDRAKFPHSEECEASVLGGVILSNDLLDELPDLEVEHFLDFRHKAVFAAMRTLQAKQSPIDPILLEAELTRVGKIDAVGGLAFLAGLQLRVSTAENVHAYVELVQLHARNRDLILRLAKQLERAQNWPHDPREMWSDIIGELSRRESDIREAQRVETKWAQPLNAFLGDAEPDDDDAKDWIIRDIVPRAEAVLLGGPMKGGKTWTALDLSIAIAMGRPWLGTFANTLGRPAKVLGLFLEDNQRRLSKRLWELTRSHGTTPNMPVLQEHLRISRAPLRLPDATDQRRLVAEIKAWGAEFVAIDNLTRVMVGDPNKTTDASAFTRAWLEIVEETGASLMFLHHTRKPGGGDQKQIDPFDTLRGSGDFGAAARNIVVTTPIRSEDGAAKLSEVRMRGNLDLRRESFTLGFERAELAAIGKVRACLVDKGELEVVRQEVALANKSAKEKAKHQEFRLEIDQRKQVAIRIATVEGHVSMARLASELGKKSPNAVKAVFEELMRDKIFVRSRNAQLGYELADQNRQEAFT